MGPSTRTVRCLGDARRFPLVRWTYRENCWASVFQLLTNWPCLVELQVDFFRVGWHDHFF